MGKVYTGLDERLRQFISAQPVFFVATAPTGPTGHVNVSPKGYRDTFAILGPHTVAYLDLTGSGAETIAHLRQNGRITIMFCSFTTQPKILRLQGSGRVILPTDPGWQSLAGYFPATAGGASEIGTANRRAIILVTLDRIADSCGYAVPVMDLAEERDLLTQWAGRKTPGQLDTYRAERNATSIDGIPALS
ncbi:MAG TPA: pyridoxamine 5'-phosphate oxidase family protein [Streptosporangiaceae bacterium]